MNTITRRNIITGAAALPFLPASALAAPVTLPLLPVSAYAQPADPAVEAYRLWRATYGAFEGSLASGVKGRTHVLS